MAACAVFAILSLSGCTKYDPYTGEAFDCNCGNLTWDNRELNMRMAEVEDLGDNVYRYHIIADMREPFEIEEHSEPRDIVLTLTTELLGPTTTIGLAAGEDDLVLQQIDSPSRHQLVYGGCVFSNHKNRRHPRHVIDLLDRPTRKYICGGQWSIYFRFGRLKLDRGFGPPRTPTPQSPSQRKLDPLRGSTILVPVNAPNAGRVNRHPASHPVDDLDEARHLVQV